jgi:hypothetical protein
MPIPEKKCGARTRKGTKCLQPAMPNGRCRLHGGLTPRGLSSANFRTGKYSKDLPANIVERYHEFLSDEEYTELRNEQALVGAFLAKKLQNLDTGDSGWFRRELNRVWRDLEKARRDGDAEEVARLLNDLGELIKHAYNQQAAEDEAVKLIDKRRALAESERRRKIEEQHIVAVEQVVAWWSAMGDIVRRHVEDRKIVGAINDEFRSLVEGQPGVREDKFSQN